ncbi:hypothetical protein Btru_045566 [Bulinus truncatus]|nr:hypothetical protein Btru_045566 [Bulinus truncatus]
MVRCLILLQHQCTSSDAALAEGDSYRLLYKPSSDFISVSFLVDRGNGYEGITRCNYSSKQCVSNTYGYAQFLIYNTSINPYTILEIKSVSRSMVNWTTHWTDINGQEHSPVYFNITINGTSSNDVVAEGDSYRVTYKPYLDFISVSFLVDRGNGYEGITRCNYSSKQCVNNTSGYAQFLIYDTSIETYTTLEIKSVSKSMVNWTTHWTDIYGNEHLPVDCNIIINGTASRVFVPEGGSYILTYVSYFKLAYASFLVDRGNGYEGITRCYYSSKLCVNNSSGYSQFLFYDNPLNPKTTLEIKSVTREMTNWILVWVDTNGYEHLPVSFNITTNKDSYPTVSTLGSGSTTVLSPVSSTSSSTIGSTTSNGGDNNTTQISQGTTFTIATGPVSSTIYFNNATTSSNGGEYYLTFLYLTICFAVLLTVFIVLFIAFCVLYFKLRKIKQKLNVYNIPGNYQHNEHTNSEFPATQVDLDGYIEIKHVDYYHPYAHTNHSN